MAATFAHMSTISPPRLTRQFQLASDPGLHHPPVLCCRETNLLPSLNAFLFSLYERYTLLCDLSSGNLARQGFPISRKTPRPLPPPGNTTSMKNRGVGDENWKALPCNWSLRSTHKSKTLLCWLAATSIDVRGESTSELTRCQARSIYEWMTYGYRAV